MSIYVCINVYIYTYKGIYAYTYIIHIIHSISVTRTNVTTRQEKSFNSTKKGKFVRLI